MTAPTMPLTDQAATFDWPLCYEAERLVGGLIEAFLMRNSFARRLAGRMRDETGTDFSSGWTMWWSERRKKARCAGRGL